MADYAALIGFTIDDRYEQIVLSTVEDTSINSSTNIAMHPLVNGDVVADHMIKQPISLSISGIIDNKEAKAIIINEQTLNLGNVQEIFERIQKEGILCNVTKVKVNEKSEGTPISFLTRGNMALNSLSWSEGINSMSFTFNFTQVLMAEAIDYDIDKTDENLPDIEMPEVSNFATELFDEVAASAYFNELILNDKNLVTDDFVDMLVQFAKFNAAGVAAGIFATVVLGISIAITGTAGAGAILVAGAALLLAVAYGIYALVDWIEHTSTYKINKFKKYVSDKKNQKELDRYTDMIESLLNQLKALDNQIIPFRIQVNKPQEALVSIGNQYYDFVFERNNTTNKWSMKLIDMNNKLLAEMSDVQTAPVTIMQQNIKYLYKTNDNYYIYIIKSQESSGDLDDLTNYCIVASLTDLSNFTEEMNKILKNYIMR